jgi:hypothetical protein
VPSGFNVSKSPAGAFSEAVEDLQDSVGRFPRAGAFRHLCRQIHSRLKVGEGQIFTPARAFVDEALGLKKLVADFSRVDSAMVAGRVIDDKKPAGRVDHNVIHDRNEYGAIPALPASCRPASRQEGNSGDEGEATILDRRCIFDGKYSLALRY